MIKKEFISLLLILLSACSTIEDTSTQRKTYREDTQANTSTQKKHSSDINPRLIVFDEMIENTEI